MNEKGANIDLLFRNGLKDFEVLPPQGAWDTIRSSVKSKSRPYTLLRIAAVVTVLLTLSFFTYRWSRSISQTPSLQVTALNIPASSPVMSGQASKMQYSPVQQRIINTPDARLLTDNMITDQPQTGISSPERVVNISNTSNVAGASNYSRGELLLPQLKKSNEVAEIRYPDLNFNPEIIITKPEHRWSVTAMASPTYFSRINTGTDALSKELMASEQPLISYAGGVSFSYKISKRFSIQSGLYYSSLGQKLDGINSFSGFQSFGVTKGGPNFRIPTTNGIVSTSNPDIFLAANGNDRILTPYTKDVFDPTKASLLPLNSSLNQSFGYLELPVVLRYKLVDKTLGINLVGGLSYNLLVNNSVYTTINGNRYSVGETEGLKPHTFSSSLGMGMEYNFSSKLSLNLEPTFRYYLNPFSTTTGSFIHPFSFGIFSGVSYKF